MPVPPREEIEHPSYSYLQVLSLHLEQAAAQRNRHRMRSILCFQLGDEIFDVEVDRRLGDGQLVRDLLVAIPIANQPEHLQFAHGEVIFAEMLGQACRDLRRYVAPARMRRTDCRQQVVFGHAFQEVSGGPGSHGALNLAIAVRGREHDYASSRELTANGDKNVGAVRAGKLQIHQGHVRLIAAKFSNSLHPITRKSHQSHIGLRCDNRGQTLPENWVVFDAQDFYWRDGTQQDTSWRSF